MSITHMYKKYKGILPLLLIISSILIYAFSLFIIGYIEGAGKSGVQNIKKKKKTEERIIKYTNVDKKGSVIASKSGKKYYFPWCSGINRIKIENRIYFDTELDAQNKGLTLASSCF